MYSMNDSSVKSMWKIKGIEYAGIGDRPYFILTNENGGVKLVPIERGITNLRDVLDLN